ncbi:NAD(P)-dependent dehydrogenase (short-subunit alcohol dehydrogenase family) [Enterobacter sp. BIGb0383]|uniref:SDR family NAD(P)-dependent oxidoreductase n=1 Tax=unclassified Enterobacter TaxID=2608935 RepID=UPI000F45F166|nr:MULTISPECIES: SDR family oxidoreductase [unclassified Enterobacter]ROP61760.1 NAD(P)-dependent dehydrogenase (short-subunit alcohol dehydrogenase family) [Enterobacter sp. BIGb0383]ROS11921.1 NAD(P)-dependent dehydrogenase (short-subunit alcohol dehydrogenase family) [Enterobacter sp. BIGb0359]
MSELQGKHLIVIGGSSGIGFAVAQLAGLQGAAITLIGRSQARLDQARALLVAQGTKVRELVVCDAHDHTALTDCFSRLPPFDHLVSMIGDAMGGSFLAADMATIEQVIHSKFLTNVLIGKLAAKKLRPGGSVTFTSGTGGRAQHACASYVGNLGIQALAQGLAAEIAPRGRVNAVAPTWTVTPFWREQPEEQVEATRQHFASVIPLGRTAEIDELASAYLFLMTNDFITGQQLAVDGGIMLG